MCRILKKKKKKKKEENQINERGRVFQQRNNTGSYESKKPREKC